MHGANIMLNGPPLPPPSLLRMALDASARLVGESGSDTPTGVTCDGNVTRLTHLVQRRRAGLCGHSTNPTYDAPSSARSASRR
jgi:hypothetical protein